MMKRRVTKAINRIGRRIIFPLCTLCLLTALAKVTFAQSSPIWTGSLTCQLNDQEQGAYQRQEIQTWTLTGGPRDPSQAMPVYPATWTAQAQGQLLRQQGTQATSIQWMANVSGGQTPPVGLVITVRNSDKRLMIKQWTVNQSAPNAVSGRRQVFVNGVPQGQPVTFNRALQQWQFPLIEASPTDDPVAGSTQIRADAGSAEFVHRFGGGGPTATCQWRFTKGGGGGQTPGPAGTMGGGGSSNQNPQNPNGNSGPQINNPTGMGGGTQTSNQQGSQTPTPASPASNPNCDSPAAVQQSFEVMKQSIKSSYDALIQGTTDQAQITSLTQQEQKTLATINAEEQHDMQKAAADGCTGAGHGGVTQGQTNPPAASNPSGEGETPTTSSEPQVTPSPTNVRATAGDSSAIVTWTSSAGSIASYLVQTLPKGPVSTTSANQLTISGLVNGSTYTFQVVAVSNQGLTSSPVASNPVTPVNPAAAATGSTGKGPVIARQPSVPTQTSASGAGQNLAISLPASLSSVRPGNSPPIASLAITLTGSYTHFADGKTTAIFVPAQAQSGTNSGCVSAALNKAADSYAQILGATNLNAGGSSATNSTTGSAQNSTANACPPAAMQVSVKVNSPTSAIATLNIDPTATPGGYNVIVTTSLASGQEVVSLDNAFFVVPSAGTGAYPTVASTKYRVVISGLMCMKHISSNDAVYAAAVVRQYDRRNNQTTMSTNLNTWVYGDVNVMQGQRKPAGTRGPGGGIGDGDLVPITFMPGVRDTMPTPQVNNLLPLTLWEGTLSDGVDALVISPSLWINYGDNPFFSTWNQNEDSFTNSIFMDTHVQNQINTQTLGTVVIGSSQTVGGSAVQSVAGDYAQAIADTILVIPFVELQGNPSHDRPIGVADANPSDPTSSMILPNTTLVLTREMIEKRLGSGSWMMMPLDLKDTAHGFTQLAGSDQPGEYQMFIQIERQ